MLIRPLAITNVHWKTFIDTCQEKLGFSPTRGLDVAGIKIDSPAAYLGCVDFKNDPVNQIRRGHRAGGSWSHVHASFIFHAGHISTLQIMMFTDLKITGKMCEDGTYLNIATGDMREWHDAVVICCREPGRFTKEVREFGNYVLVYLQEAGFRIWQDFDKTDLGDGTFRLEES